MQPKKNLFEIVLFEPLIPNNTGNIARLCVGCNCSLTLVEPLGFSISDKSLKRAGLDYWQHLEFHATTSLRKQLSNRRFALFSKFGTKPFYEHTYRPGDCLVFGKETTGLPKDVIDEFKENTYFMPMPGKVRSINLSNSVAAAVYEGMRQIYSQESLAGMNRPLASEDDSFVLPLQQKTS